MLKDLMLEDKRKTPVRQLSGGMKRKLRSVGLSLPSACATAGVGDSSLMKPPFLPHRPVLALLWWGALRLWCWMNRPLAWTPTHGGRPGTSSPSTRRAGPCSSQPTSCKGGGTNLEPAVAWWFFVSLSPSFFPFLSSPFFPSIAPPSLSLCQGRGRLARRQDSHHGGGEAEVLWLLSLPQGKVCALVHVYVCVSATSS